MNLPFDQNEELEDVPLLKSLKRGSLDQHIPEGYFSAFSARLQEKLEDAEAMANAPTLYGLSEKNLFQAPEGYFDELPRILSQRIAPARVIPFKLSEGGNTRFGTVMARLAAAVALLAGLWFVSPNESMRSSQALSPAELAVTIDWEDYDIRTLEDAFGEELLNSVATASEESSNPALEMLNESDLQQIYLN